jgi:hypothetical protein
MVKELAPHMADIGYSGTPLVKKLGIKAGMTVALIGAPDDFEKLLKGLPKGVKPVRGPSAGSGQADLVIWWPASARDMESRIRAIDKRIADGGSIWISWAKKASGIKTDLSDNVVRETGLANGLVDYKVCAISEIWSGLKFARRKK